MEERNPRQIAKTVGIVLAALAAMVLYVFVSSGIQGRNASGKTADMYGVDSLTYIGEPVMKISVWQDGEWEYSENSNDLAGSSQNYTLVPLTLKPGEKVSTERDGWDEIYNPFILITVEYDGEIFGEYEIKVRNMLTYSGSKDAVPGLSYGGSTGGKAGSAEKFVQEDSSFAGNRVVTLKIMDLMGNDYLQGRLLKDYNIDLNDFVTKERLTDLYPDVPPELKDLYYEVLTTHITIHAKHPTKTDVTVATAVLKVRRSTGWIGATREQLQLLEELKYNDATNEVEVVSYTQSDAFAFE